VGRERERFSEEKKPAARAAGGGLSGQRQGGSRSVPCSGFVSRPTVASTVARRRQEVRQRAQRHKGLERESPQGAKTATTLGCWRTGKVRAKRGANSVSATMRTASAVSEAWNERSEFHEARCERSEHRVCPRPVEASEARNERSEFREANGVSREARRGVIIPGTEKNAATSRGSHETSTQSTR
jgi:hypothetical protein